MLTLGLPPSGPAPAVPAGTGAAPSVPNKARASGWLTAVAITAIALGAIDVIAGLTNVVAPRFLAFQTRTMTGTSTDNPVTKAQQEMNQATIEVYERHQGLIQVNAVGGTLAGALLIVGGIGCLGLRRWSRALLVVAFAAALMLNLGTAAPSVRMRGALAAVNTQHFERIMSAGNGGRPEVQQIARTMGSFVRVTGTLTLVGMIALMAVSALACVAGPIFLLHPRTRARFQPAQPAPP